MRVSNTLKSFLNPRYYDPHLNQTKFDELFPLTIAGVLACMMNCDQMKLKTRPIKCIAFVLFSCKVVILQYLRPFHKRFNPLWSFLFQSCFHPRYYIFNIDPRNIAFSSSSLITLYQRYHQGSRQKLLSGFFPLRGYPPPPYPLNRKLFCQKTLSGKKRKSTTTNKRSQSIRHLCTQNRILTIRFL